MMMSTKINTNKTPYHSIHAERSRVTFEEAAQLLGISHMEVRQHAKQLPDWAVKRRGNRFVVAIRPLKKRLRLIDKKREQAESYVINKRITPTREEREAEQARAEAEMFLETAYKNMVTRPYTMQGPGAFVPFSGCYEQGRRR
jgi:predicted ArsR family transcriptional regulator